MITATNTEHDASSLSVKQSEAQSTQPTTAELTQTLFQVTTERDDLWHQLLQKSTLDPSHELTQLKHKYMLLKTELDQSNERIQRLDAELVIATDLSLQAESALSQTKVTAFEAGIGKRSSQVFDKIDTGCAQRVVEMQSEIKLMQDALDAKNSEIGVAETKLEISRNIIKQLQQTDANTEEAKEEKIEQLKVQISEESKRACLVRCEELSKDIITLKEYTLRLETESSVALETSTRERQELTNDLAAREEDIRVLKGEFVKLSNQLVC
jgi:hypothetical protein